MVRMLLAVSLLVSPLIARADSTVNVAGVDVSATWARCPFVLLMSQRAANRKLDLDLDGKIVLTGNIAPRVEYTVTLKGATLRVDVAASGVGGDTAGWHPPETAGARVRANAPQILLIEHAGLLGSIRASNMTSPLIGIFQAAVEECMGIKPSKATP